jgi:MFS superfamily sulfate permease-like transporter
VTTRLVAANPDQGLAKAFTVVMVASTVQIFFGVPKLGRYITLMPYSVISGFMSGIRILLVFTQTPPLLGQATPAGGPLAVLLLPRRGPLDGLVDRLGEHRAAELARLAVDVARATRTA